MAQGLSSLLGGLAQGFTDLGKSTLDVLGSGTTNNVLTAGLDALINKKSYGQAVKDANQRQKDFRKWLYETESDKDAAAKGLGTALNGAQTAIDLIPGLGQSAPVNAIQGAIGGLADEFKFNGENYDWGKGAQRAAVGAGAGLAAGGLGKALANSGSKVLSNGVLKGAATGSLGGALSQAGGTAIEGGNADQILRSAAQGAQFGALLGAGTGGVQSLAGALKKTRAKNNAPVVMAELAPETTNVYDSVSEPAKGYKRLYRGLTQEYDPNYPTNKLDTSGYESWTDNPELAKQYGKNVYYIDVPETDIKTSYLDENPMSETYGDRNPIYSIDKKAGLNGVSGKEYLLYMDDPYQKNLKYNLLPDEEVMSELAPEQSAVADAMLSPEQKEYFKGSKLRDENGNLIKMYHGTPDGSFTEFNEGSYFTPNKKYADGYQWEGASVLRSNKKAVNPKTYEVYINTEKPFTLSDPKARDIYLNEYIKGGNSMYYDPYTDWTKAVNDLSEVDWTEGEGLREWLKENHPEYDALYLDEGGDGGYGEAEYRWRGNSVVPFNANQIKDVNNLTPTDNANIMASRVAPGQLGLFDQTQTTTPKTATAQLGLFDQPTQLVTPKTIDAADVNPYAPVNGKITDTMRDRASEIIDNLALKRQIPDNELFNRIDPATLPKGQQGVGKFLDEAYAKGLSHADIVDMMRETVSSEFDKRLGKTPDKEKLISFIFGDADETAKKEMMDKELGLYVAPETVSESTLNSMAIHKISDEIYGNNLSALSAGNRTLRGGYTGALDSVLSERLGIAPGNTYKKTGTYDTGGTLGRFQEYPHNPYKNNIMVETALNNEDAINTMAHERLHSFQTEAKKLYDQDRYSPEVKNAYDELAKDLKRAKAYKSGKEIRNRYYGRNMAYWRLHDEQEARMLQQYLDAKGYTGSRHHNENQYLGLEFDDAKITPAFDKFFDKLRELSKKGVALPAILAALGLGEYATENQEEDKDNGQQI